MLGVPETPREARVWDATYQAIQERGYEFDERTHSKSGASAVVMKAREKGLKRDVALKVIVDPTSERSRKLFERESKMLTAAGLPEVVVRYHTKIEPKGKEHQPVLVLEWIDGQSLGEFLKRQPPRLERRLELTRELFERLAELHESGWFWRDLSPNNILIDRKTGHLRFIDFGLAKLQADRQASIHTLGPGGTPYFTKDAILAGEIQATVQDDVRAAAMMALRVLGVENARTRDGAGVERLRERRDLIRELRSNQVPMEFGYRLIDVLVAAEDRPENTPSAKEVADRLGAWFKERAERRRKTRLLASLAAFALLLSTLLFLGWQAYRQEVRLRRLAGAQELERQIEQRPNLGHPAMVPLLDRARETKQRLDAMRSSPLGGPVDALVAELLGLQREALAASHELEAAEPLRSSLGKVLVHTPWEPGAANIDQRRKAAEQRLLECGRQLDEGRFEQAWGGLRSLEKDLAQLAADNAIAVRAVRARADYRRLERGLTDRLRALPQYAPIAARALDAERLLAEGRYDDSRGPGAGTEFTQAKAQLETLLVQQESTEERRQRLTQDETTVATQETRITALEQERVEAQTRLEQFQSLLTRAESERSSLEAAKQALADEVSALQGRLEQANTDLQTAATQSKDLSKAGEQLRQDLTQKQARIQELEARIQKTDAELAAARTSESKAVERSKQLDLELGAARQEIGTLRTQLTAAGSEPRSGGASAAAAAGGTAAAEAGASDLSQPARGRSHVNSIGMRLLGVDAGTFEMGSPSNESERDSDEQRHSVRLTQAFWMAETEVTQGQWLAVMKAEPRGGFDSDNKGAEVAANTLSWTEAMDFCRRLTEQEQRAGRLPQGYGYTLPTEAQWEYACRAGTRTPFSFDGDQRLLGQYAVYSRSRDGAYAHRVKGRKPNPWGFYDMHGNVWEWCLDSWGGGEDIYRDGITDPLAQGGPQRVYRGGGWLSSDERCRSALRDASIPSSADVSLGFRPVLAPLTAAGSEPRSDGGSAPAAAGGAAAAEAGASDLAQPARGRSHVNSIGMRLLGVDAGTFELGSPSNEDGRDSDEQRHSVRLTQAFWMAETEVTQGQWLAVMKAEPEFGFHSANKGAEVAANTLSWTEAMDFCRRLTEQEQRAGRLPQGFAYTLPTEAQWEYACRAGTRTPFSFGGDERQLGQYAVYSGSRDGAYAHRVKSRKPNPWGFYDMHGNVWEWCLDEVDWSGGVQSDTYRDGITDPLAQGGPLRVSRGGGWDGSPASCRSADRGANDPSGAFGGLGFRPVLAPRSGGGAR